MSFILEALKKVERQHAQNRTPLAVSGTISITPQGKRLPLLIITGLIAVMMFGLGVILARQEAAREGMETAALNDERIAAPEPGVLDSFSESNAEVPVVSSELNSESDQSPADIESDSTESIEKTDGRVVHLADLPAGIRAELSTLKVDVHYYQDQPENRFVMINQQRYVEGDQLISGPLLVEIINNGVILKHRGQRFILPRL